jgi:F-type H+-transporting ATPase subunit b
MQDIIIPAPGSIIWTIAVFVVLLLVLRKWAWKPILEALQSREDGIRRNISEAEKSREEAQVLLQQYKTQLDQARKEAQKMINEANARAEVIHQERKKEIETEARAMIEKARLEIGQERQKVVQELRQEVVEIALTAAGKVIGQALRAEDHRDLIDREIEKLN